MDSDFNEVMGASMSLCLCFTSVFEFCAVVLEAVYDLAWFSEIMVFCDFQIAICFCLSKPRTGRLFLICECLACRGS